MILTKKGEEITLRTLVENLSSTGISNVLVLLINHMWMHDMLTKDDVEELFGYKIDFDGGDLL